MVRRMGAPKRAHSAIATELQRTLRAAGLRSTAPRVAVLRALEESPRPVSHSELAELLSDGGFDRTTIYRNLIDLTEAGLARRTDLGDHIWRFERLRPGTEDHSGEMHAHFTCTDCGTVECLPEGAVELSSPDRAPRAISKRAVEVQLRGVCDSCD